MTSRLSTGNPGGRAAAAILVLLLILLPGVGSAAVTTVLDDAGVMAPELEFWHWPQGTVESDQTLASLLKREGERIGSTQSNFGYTSDTYWFRLRITNPSGSPRNRLIVVHAPQLDDLRFLEYRGETQVRSLVTGENHPFRQRWVPVPEYAFPISLEPGETRTYLFRARSEGSLLFPLKIWQERDYLLEYNRISNARSLYYGLLLFVILFNIFIYFTLKEPMYLHYVLYIGSILLIQATLHGRTFQVLWPNLPGLSNLVILVSVPLVTLAANEFSRRFLELPQRDPFWNRLLSVGSLLAALNLLATPLLPPEIAKAAALLIALLCTAFLLIVGPLMWWRGIRQARLFTAGWLFLLIGVAVTGMLELGVLPYNLLTTQSIQLGSAAEAVILSLAIVERIYQERNQRLQVQQQIIEEQKERQRLEAFRLHEATHSPTSELPNRAFLNQFGRDQIRMHPAQPFALCLIRLNRYHDIDRTLGQDIADQLIYQLGIQINEFIDGIDGYLLLEQGNEGPVYLASMDESTLAAFLPLPDASLQNTVHSAIQPLREFLLQRIRYGHLSLDLDPRIGVAQYPTHAESIEGLMRAAKIALEGTSHIEGCIALYRAEVDPYSERRLTLMAELDQAIEHNHLYLCFQPILDLQSRQLVSLEALVRWTHPTHGEISPGEFVPLAEQSGNIGKLTQWVLEEGLRKLVQLGEAGFAEVGVSLNLSVIDLESAHFADRLLKLLEDTGASARRLTLELTETAVMKDPQLALAVLRSLSQHGIAIALDDFGTGYSSLTYLRELPLSKIKIDRAFTRALEHSEDARVIVNTILTMCHTLGYEVVAEGVENEAAARWLDDMGCDQLQGFWLGRPMLWDFTLEWLRSFEQFQAQHPGFVQGLPPRVSRNAGESTPPAQSMPPVAPPGQRSDPD